MHEPDGMTDGELRLGIARAIIESLKDFKPEEQIEAVRKLIGEAIHYMPRSDLEKSRQTILDTFPKMPFVAEMLRMIDGQIELRNLGCIPEQGLPDRH